MAKKSNFNFGKQQKVDKASFDISEIEVEEDDDEEIKVKEDVIEEIKEQVRPGKIFKAKVFNCKSLNIREEPSKEDDVKVLQVVLKDTVLLVEKISDKWSRVYSINEVELEEGYVMSEFLKEL